MGYNTLPELFYPFPVLVVPLPEARRNEFVTGNKEQRMGSVQ